MVSQSDIREAAELLTLARAQVILEARKVVQKHPGAFLALETALSDVGDMRRRVDRLIAEEPPR